MKIKDGIARLGWYERRLLDCGRRVPVEDLPYERVLGDLAARQAEVSGIMGQPDQNGELIHAAGVLLTLDRYVISRVVGQAAAYALEHQNYPSAPGMGESNAA